ncbi:SUMF1/EgtB/PvdO family nonheme iron enzyme [Lewinella sp. W8]|uniref:SUMF1/EgtB/PvdO family nonheme iron enzyme n=1 Tax=Lewinella sp. W8 TaxID=2528208 RepID=UPI00106772AD|nr:SUMF1/EgtB/PvdO family nonheme iron enzyme [Lewinella sp. W8]MTB52994.1 SUMF1/EgtB/PvdO family nonheme iron enzyme [Lewinella sp. W8]
MNVGKALVFFLFLGVTAGAMYSCSSQEEDAPQEIPEGMVWIAGEANGRAGFLMDAHEVTTADFAAFVGATGYVTEAEEFGWSGVFSTDSLGWLPVDSATWRYPLGPNAPAADSLEPVTQVSFRDAEAYASWAGKRLPTEEEWLWAASQGGQESEFPWGNRMIVDGKFPGNWWQGPFPYEDEVLDGFPGIAPVRSFPPAPNGLYDISGNVWEWTTTKRPETGEYVIRGGSFLCSVSYCTGFNLRQRQYTPADSGLNHLGFRCILEAK